MQAINFDSKDTLILALTGIVFFGTWLAYRLNLFTFLSTINDEKKILLPSFLFLFSPFLFPFIFSHPLPSALSPIIPVTTFIIGQLLAESNNKKMLSAREKEAINQLYAKFSINFETAKNNESHLKNYLTKEVSPCWNDLSPMEDIKEELIKVVSFQGLIIGNLPLASNHLIISTRRCASLIDNFNAKLTQRKIAENEVKGSRDNTECIPYYWTITAIDKSLLSYTEDFLLYKSEFLDMI
jgi:hypothetical protein